MSSSKSKIIRDVRAAAVELASAGLVEVMETAPEHAHRRTRAGEGGEGSGGGGAEAVTETVMDAEGMAVLLPPCSAVSLCGELEGEGGEGSERWRRGSTHHRHR